MLGERKIWVNKVVCFFTEYNILYPFVQWFCLPRAPQAWAACRPGVLPTAQASKQVTWILKERSDMQFRHHTRSADVHAIPFRRHNSYRTPREWEGDTGRGWLSYLHTKEKAKAGQEPSQTER